MCVCYLSGTKALGSGDKTPEDAYPARLSDDIAAVGGGVFTGYAKSIHPGPWPLSYAYPMQDGVGTHEKFARFVASGITKWTRVAGYGNVRVDS